jgi:hypothetical protein
VEAAQKDPLDMLPHWVEALRSYHPAGHPLQDPDSDGPDMCLCADDGLLFRFPAPGWMAIALAAERADDSEYVEKLVRPLIICLGLVHDDVVQSKHQLDNHASWLVRCRIFLRMILGQGGRKGTLRAYVAKGLTVIKDMMEHHKVYLEVFSGPDREKFLAGHQIVNAAVVELFFRRMEAGKVVQFSTRTLDTLGRPTLKTWMVCALLQLQCLQVTV